MVWKHEFMGVRSFFICWALQLVTGMTVRNPMTVVLFLCALAAEKRSGASFHKKIYPALYAVSLAGGAAFACAGFNRAAAGFDSGLFRAFAAIILFIGGSCLADLLIRMAALTAGAGRGKETEVSSGKEKERGRVVRLPRLTYTQIFAATFIICLLCYLPYYLYEYPGIMTADSLVQYEQVIGVRAWSNHHPVIHTLCIAFFYRVGLIITGDELKAVGLYTFAQMLFMVYCASRITLTVQRICDGFSGEDLEGRESELSLYTVLTAAFFALVPFNAVFAVTVWKDVPFAGIAMLMTARLCDVLLRKEAKAWDIASLMILGILLGLFRSNALFAIIIAAPFILITFRKKLPETAAALAIIIATVIIIRGPVMDRAGIEQADFTESLSVPLQQVVRVLVNDRDLTDDELSMIDAVIDRTYIHELYAPDFADNIKELVRAGHPEAIENDKAGYFGLWLRLLARYPADYIRAWYDLEGGYIYPDVMYDVGNIDGIMDNNLGLYSTPLIGGRAVIKAKEIFIKLGSFVPIYGMLWSAGTYTWLMLIALTVMLTGKGFGRYALLTAIPLAVIFTLCIAAPMVDFRYAYAGVVTMPVYAVQGAFIFLGEKRK